MKLSTRKSTDPKPVDTQLSSAPPVQVIAQTEQEPPVTETPVEGEAFGKGGVFISIGGGRRVRVSE